MEKIAFGLDDDSATSDQKHPNIPAPLVLKLNCYVKHLSHVFQSKDADDKLKESNCLEPRCQTMKRIFQHTKICKQSSRTRCNTCKQLIVVWWYHAKYCQEPKCPIPLCPTFKNKLRQQNLKQRLQQAQSVRRHIATMQNRNMCGDIFQSSSKNPNSSSQLSPGDQLHSSFHPSHSGIVMKPLLESSVDALQATAMKQVTHANNIVVHPSATNTGLIAPKQQMQTQMQKPISEMMLGSPDCTLNMRNVVSQEYSLCAQNLLPYLNIQPLSNSQVNVQQLSQITGKSNPVPNSPDSTMESPQVMSDQNSSVAGMQSPTYDWQELLQTLEVMSLPKTSSS